MKQLNQPALTLLPTALPSLKTSDPLGAFKAQNPYHPINKDFKPVEMRHAEMKTFNFDSTASAVRPRYLQLKQNNASRQAYQTISGGSSDPVQSAQTLSTPHLSIGQASQLKQSFGDSKKSSFLRQAPYEEPTSLPPIRKTQSTMDLQSKSRATEGATPSLLLRGSGSFRNSVDLLGSNSNLFKKHNRHGSMVELPSQDILGTATLEKEGSKFGIQGYKFNPELRFNFGSKSFKLPNTKIKRYLDTHMADKKKIPSPDKYSAHRKNFFDDTKKSKIYMMSRKSSIDEVIGKSKQTPGIGRYNTTLFDEKKVRPPKGVSLEKQDRYTIMDENIYLSKHSPSHYNAVRLDAIKKRPYQQVPIHKESESALKFVEERAKQEAKRPSPTSYRVEEAFEKSGHKVTDSAHKEFVIPKDKKVLYTQKIQDRAKKLPGVGKYDADIALDKVARPMKSYKNY